MRFNIPKKMDRTSNLVTELMKENQRMRDALKKVEWLPSGAHFYCPQCYNIKMLGHHRNCIYRANEAKEGEE